MGVVILFRPMGPAESELVKASGFTKWPPRLPGQPFFYPVTNEAYAREINEQWNIPQFGKGHVAKFAVKSDFIEAFEVQTVGASHHTEYWIPAEHLESLNANIVGLIEILD